MATLAMIDVSSAQGDIDWSRVAAAGIEGVFVKASEGISYQNPYLQSSLADARAAGLVIGVYHFALMGRNTAAAEAAHFLATVTPLLQAGDVPCLDAEPDPYGGVIPEDCSDWALTWLQAIEAALQAKPLLYTNRDLIDNHGLAAVAANGNGLWLAAPGVANPAVAPWPFAAAQQTSWTATVDGIDGEVDRDVFFGTAEQFRAYGLPATPAGPCAQLAARVSDLEAQLAAANVRIAAALVALGSGS